MNEQVSKKRVWVDAMQNFVQLFRQHEVSGQFDFRSLAKAFTFDVLGMTAELDEVEFISLSTLFELPGFYSSGSLHSFMSSFYDHDETVLTSEQAEALLEIVLSAPLQEITEANSYSLADGFCRILPNGNALGAMEKMKEITELESAANFCISELSKGKY